MKKKRKPRKKPTRKSLTKKLDDIFAEYIRELEKKRTGHCFFCNKPVQCCFHIITRSKYATRWEEENAVGSCFGCNYHNEHNPHKFVVKYIEVFGLKKFNKIYRKSNEAIKFSLEDLENMIEKYKNKLEEL